MGRYKLIDSPETMWKLFQEYRDWVKNNPILIEDYVGKDALRVMREKPQPYTMEGFECFVMEKTDITYPDLSEYFEGKNESYKKYFPISSRIQREIRKNQINGGMAGIYNPNITARITGLVDKSESKVTVEQPLFGDDE